MSSNNTKIYRNVAWMMGVITIFISLATSFVFESYIHCRANKGWVGFVFFYYFALAIFATIGLIKGIKEIRYAERKKALLGIFLSILGIGLTIFLGYLTELTIFVCTT